MVAADDRDLAQRRRLGHAEAVALALDDEHGDVDAVELLLARLPRRRDEREREAQDPDRADRRGRPARDARSRGAAARHDGQSRERTAAELLDHGDPGGVEQMRRRRGPAPRHTVWLLDERDRHAQLERDLGRQYEIRRADAAACAVAEDERAARVHGRVHVRPRGAVRGVELEHDGNGSLGGVFDHVEISVPDLAASERFYRTVLGTLGLEPSYVGADLIEWDDFAIVPTDREHPVSRGLHAGFWAPSHDDVDAFWQAGVDAGYRDDGAPGPRPEYGPDYYGGFLLDPDGNSAEAITSDRANPVLPGRIDHLWIRVADIAASRRFYTTIAPHAGFRLGDDTPERVQLIGADGSFSLIDDERVLTEHVHLAFPATDDATVHAFHAAALAAGYEDNGAPGERAVYHPGYYGAFVLDPDGHNVEVVNHNRG